MLLVIVYVGAVAVLFLFVVMMLDIDFAELRAGFTQQLAVRLLHRAGAARRDGRSASAPGTPGRARRRRAAPAAPAQPATSSRIGELLYTPLPVPRSRPPGSILLVAMVGAIVLTHRRRARRPRPQNDLRARSRRKPAGRGRQHAARASGRGSKL